MLWPDVEETKKIKKVDLMNEGLVVSVHIDIHRRRRRRPQQQQQQPQQPQQRRRQISQQDDGPPPPPLSSLLSSPNESSLPPSPKSTWDRLSILSLRSPFASNTSNRYLLKVDQNDTKQHASSLSSSSPATWRESMKITPIRRNNSTIGGRCITNTTNNRSTTSSIGSSKRTLLESPTTTTSNLANADTNSSSDQFCTYDEYTHTNNTIEHSEHSEHTAHTAHTAHNLVSPLLAKIPSFTKRHDHTNDNDDMESSSSHSTSSKYNFILKKQHGYFNDMVGTTTPSSPTSPIQRRFDSLRSTLSNISHHTTTTSEAGEEKYNVFDSRRSIDDGSISIHSTDNTDSWSMDFNSQNHIQTRNSSNGITNYNYDDHNYYDDEEASTRRVSILIDNKDGVITFQMQRQVMDDEEHSNGGNESSDDNDVYNNGENDNSENSTKNKDMDQKEENKKATTKPNRFELSSTNFQKDRDNKEKQFHSIRLACLEAAAEQYKQMNVEVPDLIIAQVNEHRHKLHAYSKKFQRTNSKLNFQENDDSDNNNDCQFNQTKEKKRMTIQRKRIRLRQNDEIHVSPCQCALSLVGMRGKVVKTTSESLFHNLLVPGKIEEDREGTKQEKQMASGSSRSSLKSIKLSKMVRTSSAAVNDNDESYSRDGTNQKSGRRKEKSKRKKPNNLSTNNRTDSGTFDAIGYHEITLVRNRDAPTTSTRHIFTNARNTSNGDNAKNEYSDFLDWDAITIRCASHDELDMLVKALRDSSKAKVIPFSTNPKEKLKANLKHENGTYESRERILSDPSNLPTSLRSSSNYCQAVPMHHDSSPTQKRRPSVEAIVEDRPMILTSSQRLDQQKPKNPKDKSPHEIENDMKTTVDDKTKNRWDFHFNKKEYCEVCNLYFTLLTRRHHCRQCQRSICGNCSCMLLIKGGDEKRFCNSCSADILRSQSEALRGRWKHRYLQSDKLPGKVHEACHKLGVGTVGKLPHWRNFLTTKINQRPAVGRITIELLEAIALPSVNMLNGKVDPYVRATVTGYDRDMFWTLREWMPEKRYQLCSGYVSSTLCPRWRGSGTKGGVLLTLPIISTAGAILRLEVLDHNLMRNARGKDIVLGVVEIPLSDLPNANLRQPGGFRINSFEQKKNLLYDGYCDRWYRLLSSDQVNCSSVILSKPISSPYSEETAKKQTKSGAGLKSLEEIGKKVQGLCIQPIEWFASAIKLDLPSRPEAFYEEHKKRSTIHVRIKLNASVAGDVLSHAWFPPVVKYPPIPPFDPQILFARILHVGKQLAPFQKIQQYIEKVIKWEHEPKECTRAYFIFAFHLLLLPYLVKIFHVYLFIFLHKQLKKMNVEEENDSKLGTIPHVDSINSVNVPIEDNQTGTNFQNSPSLTELAPKTAENTPSDITGSSENPPTESEDEDTARLNIAVNWIAKTWLDNKGLEILQHKLGNLGRDLKNLNSVWNGSNPLLTKVTMVCIPISFVLHFLTNPRMLWFFSTFAWYFGQSPLCVLCARMFFGFWRGCAKGLRRQHLLDAEMLQEI